MFHKGREREKKFEAKEDGQTGLTGEVTRSWSGGLL